MNIALIGYGSMGHEIESIAVRRGHSVVARFTSASPLPPSTSDYYSSIRIDCCVDFSVAGEVPNTVGICSSLGIPLVEGTTGWHDQKTELLELVRSRKGTLVHGNNFSIGAQMFFRIVRRAARLMNSFSEYDVSIHETHHTKKKDAPSGTALTLAHLLTSHMNRKTSVKDQTDPSNIQPNEISITSARLGSVFGDHRLLFHSPSDEIELIHRAHNRSGFASGAVLAAELTQEFKGVFSFEEIVFEKSFTHH